MSFHSAFHIGQQITLYQQVVLYIGQELVFYTELTVLMLTHLDNSYTRCHQHHHTAIAPGTN